MRAVNLLPEDARSQRGADIGKSGGLAYGLLAALALVLAVVIGATLLGRDASEQRDRLARTQRATTAINDGAAAMKGFESFNAYRRQRETSIGQLADGRVPWGVALRELARTAPAGMTLTSLSASSSPADGSSGGSQLRAAVQAPAFELTGCVRSSEQVAPLISDLRAGTEVERVTLDTTGQADGTQSIGAESGSSEACRDRVPFTLVVFLRPPTSTSTSTTTSAAPAAATIPAPTTTTAP